MFELGEVSKLKSLQFNVLTCESEMKEKKKELLGKVIARCFKMEGVIRSNKNRIDRASRLVENVYGNLQELESKAQFLLGDDGFYLKLSKFDDLNAKLDSCETVLDLFDDIVNHNWLIMQKEMGLTSKDSMVYFVSNDKKVVCLNDARARGESGQ